MRAHTTKQHGQNFNQYWVGRWRRYCTYITVPKHARSHKDVEMEATALMQQVYDRVLSALPLAFLMTADKTTARRMKYHHQQVQRTFVKHMSTEDAGQCRHSRKSHDRVEEFLASSSARLAGLATMLSVSHGDGTDWHTDNNDFPKHYSVVVVVGRRAFLDLQDGFNRRIVMEPGDVVYFQSSRIRHKLEWDPEDLTTDYHCVITGFTCRLAAMSAGL